jgi:hypothetical protein
MSVATKTWEGKCGIFISKILYIVHGDFDDELSDRDVSENMLIVP